MTALKSTFGLRNNVDVFSTKEAAERFTSKCVKPHLVLHGDSGKFWVACFSDAQLLTKAGYELA